MQYLYRAFDNQNQLLYIGISGKWSERLHAHEKTSEWMEQTETVKIEKFSDRASVEQAEVNAIQAERPIYNRDFNSAYESVMDHFQKLKFWAYYDAPVDDCHKSLLEMMRLSLRHLPVNYASKPARYIAFVFENPYLELLNSGEMDCRNCAAISHNKQFRNWASMVEAEIGEGEMV